MNNKQLTPEELQKLIEYLMKTGGLLSPAAGPQTGLLAAGPRVQLPPPGAPIPTVGTRG